MIKIPILFISNFTMFHYQIPQNKPFQKLIGS